VQLPGPTETELVRLAQSIVAPEDLDHFIRVALAEITELHEGNIARFRVRPSEFKRWKNPM
jgi:hypothetical protein